MQSLGNRWPRAVSTPVAIAQKSLPTKANKDGKEMAQVWSSKGSYINDYGEHATRNSAFLPN
jgi:hypothetical protein